MQTRTPAIPTAAQAAADLTAAYDDAAGRVLCSVAVAGNLGTILADQAITMGTAAALDGRALARIAAVALDSNPIVTPAP